ncbi:MAG: glucan biosynthesis protein [Alphaproteobacteria bacterium]|nr:glucan biosynthesis protein [Alphaproteobacteria bacterium]
MMTTASLAFGAVTPSVVSGAGENGHATNGHAPEGGGFGFDNVREIAEKLAGDPYQPNELTLPEKLRALDVPSYQQITYRDEAALWRDDDSRFRSVFRHLGSYYHKPIKVNVIDQGGVAEVGFHQDLFNYGIEGLADDLPAELGFAGLTLHYAADGPAHFPEIATFHGASYFRLLGRDQQYGLSARGLAIDTALPKGEEFPMFREFWLQKPEAGADEIKVLALLDSPSITGAYQFIIHPSVVTVAEVKSSLFPRRGIEKLGIAPLTSMFMFGENRGRQFDDYRPELHDSDGLLINNGSGEWLWRPLANHKSLQVSAFLDENPRGFGLFQRDLNFEHYQDLDERYHKRPSTWVEPTSPWGPGHVELIEIPSDHPDNDNVVAFWVPDAPVEAGRPIDLSYRLHSQLDQPRRPPLGRVEATRIGPAKSGGGRRFVVDFKGGRLDELAPDAELKATVKAHQGELGPITLRHNRELGGWRLAFDLSPNGEPLCEMRATLSLNDDDVTENWTYRWTPA